MTSPLLRLTFEPAAEWGLVPEHIRPGIIDYVREHRAQGSFLMALFRNDLSDAVRRADETNWQHLREIVYFVWMYAPAPCWGSPEKVEAWLAAAEKLSNETPAPEPQTGDPVREDVHENVREGGAQ